MYFTISPFIVCKDCREESPDEGRTDRSHLNIDKERYEAMRLAVQQTKCFAPRASTVQHMHS